MTLHRPVFASFLAALLLVFAPNAFSPAFAQTASAQTAPAQTAPAGHAVFTSHCAICHSVHPGQNRLGPSLAGIVGRKAGLAPNYTYSAANQASGLTWDAATLDRYLASPATVVPGTKMTFAGLKDATQRADLITYLATLH